MSQEAVADIRRNRGRGSEQEENRDGQAEEKKDF
jgi:hypothetical protein